MEHIKNILRKHFTISNWDIALPKDGQQTGSYIARSEQLSIFIKLNAPVSALQRLSEIGVTPRVLAHGIYARQTYVVQAYISSNYPDWQWFANNLSRLATFIRRYHDDQQLALLLTKDMGIHYDEHIRLDLAQLEARFLALRSAVLHTPEITAAFARLKNQANLLQPTKLVPVHNDPNTKNILLTSEGILMVDWDEIRLSDPMQDTSLILWWYVAQQHWPAFFNSYGYPLTEVLTRHIFWWVARTSFTIALWHVEHGYNCSAFLEDFMAAIEQKGNPHATFPIS